MKCFESCKEMNPKSAGFGDPDRFVMSTLFSDIGGTVYIAVGEDLNEEYTDYDYEIDFISAFCVVEIILAEDNPEYEASYFDTIIYFQDFKNSYNQALDYLKELTDVAKKYKDVMEFDKYIRLETEMETRN